MWASVQKEMPPHEPNYSSIEELFCLPVIEPKEKGAATPAKKEPKEVGWVKNSNNKPSWSTINIACFFVLFFR